MGKGCGHRGRSSDGLWHGLWPMDGVGVWPVDRVWSVQPNVTLDIYGVLSKGSNVTQRSLEVI